MMQHVSRCCGTLPPPPAALSPARPGLARGCWTDGVRGEGAQVPHVDSRSPPAPPPAPPPPPRQSPPPPARPLAPRVARLARHGERDGRAACASAAATWRAGPAARACGAACSRVLPARAALGIQCAHVPAVSTFPSRCDRRLSCRAAVECAAGLARNRSAHAAHDDADDRPDAGGDGVAEAAGGEDRPGATVFVATTADAVRGARVRAGDAVRRQAWGGALACVPVRVRKRGCCESGADW